MIAQPNLLIIGSTGRNTGKTEFACKIIEKFSTRKELIGVKVIPVDKNEEKCHRGADGCGLCDSLTADYEIIEEKTTDSPKDTSRMLKAGAKKAYLLIVDRNSLEKGIEALLEILPDKALIVIESNTIRKVIEPGLFLVIKKPSDKSVKHSCAEVIAFADKIIELNNMVPDFDPGKVLIEDDRWLIKE
jgi:hypothetical protein